MFLIMLGVGTKVYCVHSVVFHYILLFSCIHFVVGYFMYCILHSCTVSVIGLPVVASVS
jgi:hypothetical protein